MSGTTGELKKGFTTRAIVLALVIGLIALFVNIATWWALGMSEEPIPAGRVGSAMYPPYGLVFVLALASVLLGSAGLTTQEIVVVNVFGFVVADAPFILMGFLGFVFSDTYLARTNTVAAALLRFYPSLWTPGDYNLVAPMWTGNAAAPLGALLPYLAFWGFMMLLWCLMSVFHGAVMRLQYVKKEKLPFPMFIPINEMLGRYEKGKSDFMSYIKSTPFLIGLVLGSLIGILGAANYAFKFTQVFYAFGQFYMGWIGDLFGAISQRTVGGWWMLIPADIAAFYLAPMDILSSMVLLLVVLNVLFPIVAVNLGVITAGSGTGWGGPFPTVPFTIYWLPIGVGLWAIVLGYKAYGDSIKRALSRAKAAEGELSDLLVWGGFAGTWLLWLILWVAFGGNIIALLAGFIVYLVYTWGIVGTFAATGTWCGWGDTQPAIEATFWVGSSTGTFNSTGAAANTQAAWATATAPFITAGFGGWMIQGSEHPWALTGTYALAQATKTKETDIFDAQLLAMVFIAVVGTLFATYVLYGSGLGKLGGFSSGGFIGNMAGWAVTDSSPPSSMDFTQLIVAIVVAGVLFYLRASFSWWFFSPYVLFFYDNMWLLNGGISWILKVITLRVFGAKAYEETGVPIAVGFLAGVTLFAMLIMGVNSITGGLKVGGAPVT
ncbi:MAG TPA: DUF6785 family protein [Thermoproteota archaeon]|nr:DUF6785 family protein [Thermoproteota archaeon]